MSDQMKQKDFNLEVEKIHAEISKLMAETAKINAETPWYPILVGSSLLGAGAAIATVALKLFT